MKACGGPAGILRPAGRNLAVSGALIAGRPYAVAVRMKPCGWGEEDSNPKLARNPRLPPQTAPSLPLSVYNAHWGQASPGASLS